MHAALRWTGLPYVASYVATYADIHADRHFAGRLVMLKDEYRRASPERREELVRQFRGIMDGLVLTNGVKKTTYPRRQTHTLDKVLADPACRPAGPTIRVLDVPSSIGIASLDTLNLLRSQYTVDAYVLGDISFEIRYDRERGCIYDEDGNLLQVKIAGGFFSTHRGHSAGNDYGLLARLLLLPLDVVAWGLKQRYRSWTSPQTVPVYLVHPDVETKLGNGVLQVQKVDVFREIPGTYDLILSFNLLQRNYFPLDQIAHGIANLQKALADGGVLVVGSPDEGGLSAYRVFRKCGDRLKLVRREGEC